MYGRNTLSLDEDTVHKMFHTLKESEKLLTAFVLGAGEAISSVFPGVFFLFVLFVG